MADAISFLAHILSVRKNSLAKSRVRGSSLFSFSFSSAPPRDRYKAGKLLEKGRDFFRLFLFPIQCSVLSPPDPINEANEKLCPPSLLPMSSFSPLRALFFLDLQLYGKYSKRRLSTKRVPNFWSRPFSYSRKKRHECKVVFLPAQKKGYQPSQGDNFTD